MSQNPVKYNLLLVEDVLEMQELLKTALADLAYVERVRVANQVWEARQSVDRHRPDLVLLDEILPGESSVDFLNDLMSAGIPVILVTGISDPTHPLPKGAFARLVKPEWRQIPDWIRQFEGVILQACRQSHGESGQSRQNS